MSGTGAQKCKCGQVQGTNDAATRLGKSLLTLHSDYGLPVAACVRNQEETQLGYKRKVHFCSRSHISKN